MFEQIEDGFDEIVECSEPIPSTIDFYSSRLAGEPRAKCRECGFVSAYWECACDLEHNCDEFQLTF